MKILVDLGHRSRALQQYRICREVLAAELDVVPEEATERLHETIRGEMPDANIRSNVSVPIHDPSLPDPVLLDLRKGKSIRHD
jgi:DNA-binding SARP family transcriptional activator